MRRRDKAGGKAAKSTVKSKNVFGAFTVVDPVLMLIMWAIALEAYLFLRSS